MARRSALFAKRCAISSSCSLSTNFFCHASYPSLHIINIFIKNSKRKRSEPFCGRVALTNLAQFVDGSGDRLEALVHGRFDLGCDPIGIVRLLFDHVKMRSERGRRRTWMSSLVSRTSVLPNSASSFLYKFTTSSDYCNQP